MRLLGLVLLCCLTSCALQNYLAGQLDMLVELRLQNHLDLYYQQKKNLALDVDRYLNKQKTYLPEVRSFVQSIEPQKKQNVSKIIEEFTRLYQRSALEFNRLLCSYLVQLDPKQQQHFYAKQLEDNRTLEAQIKKMDLPLLTERVEFFLGDLHSSQTPLLQNYLPHWIQRSKDRLNRRIKLQQEVRDILKSNDAKEEALNRSFQQYVEQSFENTAPVVQVMEELAKTLTPEQINHLLDRKKSLLDLIDSLSKSSF